MNFLQEYLERKRVQREEAEQSPEQLLTRIASASENTASSLGVLETAQEQSKTRSLGSISARDLHEQNSAVIKVGESASYGIAELSVQQEEMLKLYKATGKSLLAAVDRLTKVADKRLAALLPKKDIRAKHTKKDPASFQRLRDAKGRFVSAGQAGRGGSLIDDALDVLGGGSDSRRDRARARRRARIRARGRVGTIGAAAEGAAEGLSGKVGTLGRIKGWFGGMSESVATKSRDLLGAGKGAVEGIAAKGRGLLQAGKGVAESVATKSSSLLTAGKSMLGFAPSAVAAGAGAVPVATAGSRATSGLGKAVGAVKGLGAGKLLGAAGGALVGLEAYNVLTDDENKDKSRDIARLGGSALGGTLGASIGTIGGPLGTAAGGVVGSMIGDKVAGGAVDVGRKLAETDTGVALLKPFMVGLNAIEAIWSKDARTTLAETFKNDIIPGFETAGSTIKDAATSMTSSLASFASGTWTTMKGWFGMAPKGQGQSIGSRISNGAASLGESASRAYASLTGGMKSVAGAPRALGALDVKAMQQTTYNDALGMREGGGGYTAINKYGYMGKYQFGKGALTDLGYIDKKTGQWTGKNGVNSQQDFINNPRAQDAANTDFAKLNWQKLNANPIKYDANGKPVYARDMVGQTIGGQTISESGLMGAAHLGGAGSVTDWLKSGGKNVAMDANGVPITNYMTTMGGKDVSNITGKPSYTGKISSFQFTGNENTYIPTANGKQYVQMSNLTGNNAINAKVAGGVVPGASPKTVVNAARPASATGKTDTRTATAASGKPTKSSAKSSKHSADAVAGTVTQDIPSNVPLNKNYVPFADTSEPVQVKQYENGAPGIAPEIDSFERAQLRNVRTEIPTDSQAAGQREVKEVRVTNAGDLRADGTEKVRTAMPPNPQLVNAVPTLANMPTYIDDAGLMAMNMGFI